MANANPQLKLARKLIEEKRYGEARLVLEKLEGDAIATAWLAKLDKLDPVPNIDTSGPKQSKSKTGSSSTLVSVAIGVVLFIFGGIIGFIAGRSSSSGSNSPVVAALVGCSLSDWWKQVEPKVIEFLDAAETATATSRASLSPIILSLRNSQRDFESLDVPDCADDVQTNIRFGMDNAVDGFNDFLGQSETVSNIEFGLASQYFWNAYTLMFNQRVYGDTRMADTSTFIWGGDKPTEAQATKMANT